MKHVSSIVLAAGRSKRFQSKIPKPLARINSKPVIIYSLDTLSNHPLVRDIIVVTNDKNTKDIIRKIRQYRVKKVEQIVKGGRRRQDSVINALSVLNNNTDLVLIHDAARPFVAKNIISSLIKEAASFGAAIVGVPLKNTVKRVARSQGHKGTGKFIVEKTIDRSNLWEIQTPQVFKKDLILRSP